MFPVVCLCLFHCVRTPGCTPMAHHPWLQVPDSEDAPTEAPSSTATASSDADSTEVVSRVG